jgi:hypothetical protein
MTPLTYPALQNLASFAGKRINPGGLLKYVRFFTIISLVVLFAFTPSSTAERVNNNINRSQVPVTSDSENPAAFPVKRTVKIRKKVSYVHPPLPVKVTELAGSPKLVRTVLVPQLFSYTVVQQPEDNPYYVSTSRDLITEFSLARRYNTIGLLAHNTLAGSAFKDITLGQEIYIIHEDGPTDRYTVSAIYRFQALESTKTESQFVDLDSGKTLSAIDVFSQMYTGAPHLTLQTCIEAEGDVSWGRLFVIATPDDKIQ